MAEKPTETALLATGFGPFLSHSYNPSWAVAQAFSDAISDSLGDGFRSRAERLDVSFELAQRFAENIYLNDGSASALTPDWLVHFGLAASSSAVKFEGAGYNRRGATSDSAAPGARDPLDGLLRKDGRARYQTRIDIGRLVELFDQVEGASLCEAGACISQDPGDYVCNAIYYHSLRVAQQVRARGGRMQVLFVHVPTLQPAEAESLGHKIAACFRAYIQERARG